MGAQRNGGNGGSLPKSPRITATELHSNTTRLLADAEHVMGLYTEVDGNGTISSEAFAMGVVYAVLFLFGKKTLLPSEHIAEWTAAGVMQ